MSIGPLQIVLILVLVLVLFGAGKLPKVMGDLGKGMRSFKDGLQNKDSDDDDDDDKKALKNQKNDDKDKA